MGETVEEAYFCGGSQTVAIPEILSSGGPHILLVTTDEGLRNVDGSLKAAAVSPNDTAQEEALVNLRERGFRIHYNLTPC